MKKTFVALAVLAAVGSASAQVTVYGKVDLGVSSSTTNKAGETDQGLEVTSNNYEGSRFGIKAEHDLTGGLKASAKYELSIDATGNTAAADAIESNRVASIGLSGSFGSVAMGMQWTPYDSAWGFDQMEYSSFSAANKTWYKGKHGDNGNAGHYMGNAKKSISYSTPDMNGLNATVLYSNSGGKTAAADSVPYLGLGVNYATGPVSINFGYEQVASTAHLGAGANAGEKTNAMIVGASYNMGFATIGAGYQQARVKALGDDFKDTGYTLSVSAPVSASTTLALGYAAETTTSAGLSDGSANSFGAMVIYNWTSQAAIYGGAYQTKATDVGSTVKVTNSKIAAGLRYNF